jgi:hypothetical protein
MDPTPRVAVQLLMATGGLIVVAVFAIERPIGKYIEMLLRRHVNEEGIEIGRPKQPQRAEPAGRDKEGMISD